MTYGDRYFRYLYEKFENNVKDDQKIRFVPLDQKEIKNKLLVTNPMNHISVVFKKKLIENYSDKDGFLSFNSWF